MHDHVVAAVPRQNHGEYTPVYQGILVLCSAEALTSGACVATFSTPPGASDPIPLATTVNGQSLTSTEAVEAAAAAGLVTLIPAGPLIGAISGN
jgi:hypothetical protein